jgi:flagellar biosynthesis protein FlhG
MIDPIILPLTRGRRPRRLAGEPGAPSDRDGEGGSSAGRVIPLRGEGERSERAARVIAVTSGKGGVGKSVISANLGVALARMGRRVLLVDADLALANLDLMLGVNARASVKDVIASRARVRDVMVEGPAGVHLLPACSGDRDLAELDAEARLALFNAIDTLEEEFDTLVIDTGAGIGSNALSFAAAAQQTLVVVTPDPASIADAYAMIKVLSTRAGLKRLYLAVNQATGPREADSVVSRLLGLVHQFLDVSVVPLGYLYRDEAVERSVKACQPLVVGFPQASITASLQALASRLLEEQPGEASWGGPRLFWKKLMGLSGQEKES